MQSGRAETKRSAAKEVHVQAPLPVVDNNRKVVGALSVVGEKFSKNLANFEKFSDIFEQKGALCENAVFGEKSRKSLVKILQKFSKQN